MLSLNQNPIIDFYQNVGLIPANVIKPCHLTVEGGLTYE